MPHQIGDITKVLDKLKDVFSSTTGLDQVMWERDEQPNEDPHHTPWGGLYKRRRRLEPRAVGSGQGSRNEQMDLIVILQTSHPDSGSACGDELEALIRTTINTVLEDQNVRTLIDMVLDIEIDYLYDLGQEDVYFQSAQIVFNAEVYTQNV